MNKTHLTLNVCNHKNNDNNNKHQTKKQDR